MAIPLFVCHANCCRSVLAHYLYEDLCPGAVALSAGVAVGDMINDRAAAMLRAWGIDASRHLPRQIDRALCDRADAIFAMGPEYLRRILETYGTDLAAKSYLFADPLGLPVKFTDGNYLVFDPSFDDRPVPELVSEFSWFRDRVVQIHYALHHETHSLVPASRYLHALIA